MTLLLQNLSIKFKKAFHWKYFAMAHGKGVVDGIGGRAKCLVRNAVMSKKSTAPIVQSAEEFANVVIKAMPSTTVMSFLDKDINRDNSMWVKAKAIPGI
ncbi:hypothetical protein AVEN_261148-1 [Araneus ventricosus]|uniref:Uncharacterized protein n=1 Tax=Araneus ventricosus TaxID=182803 RepID=A0A4Y2IZ96_ARAVE|nr:hypothetical protein AVEN_261148-1 [Araneus ventricosus]